jgi:predicted transposase/invertase (TIGR01784 family)
VNFMKQHLVRFDWALKNILRNKANFGILEGFLSELLEKKVSIQNVIESESNRVDADGKSNRVDIMVMLDNKDVAIIEVQVNKEIDYFHRMLYGVSKVITEHLQKGEAYGNVKKVYSVNIIYFDLGDGDDDYVYHGTTSFKGRHSRKYLGLTLEQRALFQKSVLHEIYPEYYIIKIKKFQDKLTDKFDEWVYFLKNEEIKSDFHARGLNEAKEKLDELKLSDQEQVDYKHYLDDLHYEASMIYANASVAKLEGLQEGEKIGMEKGRMEEKLEIARKLKALKIIPLNSIQEALGLSIAEIERL